MNSARRCRAIPSWCDSSAGEAGRDAARRADQTASMDLMFWKGKTTPAGFRDRYRAALLERFPGATAVDSGELDLEVTGVPAYATATLNLTRAYAEYQRDPKQFDAIFARYSAALAGPAVRDGFELDAVVPMIKDREWLAQMDASLRAESRGNLPFAVPLNAELVVTYAETSKSLWFLTEDAVRASGIAHDELHAKALENLAARAGPRQVLLGGESVYLIGVGGNYEAATMLDDALWRDARLVVDGQRLVAVPDRDTLFVARDDSPWSVWALATGTLSLTRSQPYPISASVFVHVGPGRYEPIDDGRYDETHPIPRLDVIDIYATLIGGGATLSVVIAAALDDSPRSVFRLFRKIEGYLDFVNGAEYRAQCGAPDPATTSIEVALHPGSSRKIRELLERVAQDAPGRNANLRTTDLDCGRHPEVTSRVPSDG